MIKLAGMLLNIGTSDFSTMTQWGGGCLLDD